MIVSTGPRAIGSISDIGKGLLQEAYDKAKEHGWISTRDLYRIIGLPGGNGYFGYSLEDLEGVRFEEVDTNEPNAQRWNIIFPVDAHPWYEKETK